VNWRQGVFLAAPKLAGISDRFRIHDRGTPPPPSRSRRATRPRCCRRSWGHASITTTLDLYGHLYLGNMDKYADRLDDAATGAGRARIRPDEAKDGPEDS
jgi:hypothetical protein